MTKAEMAMVEKYERFVADRIAEIREEAGLKRNELSYLIDCGTNFISNVEGDLSAPSLHALFSIMVVTKASPRKFFSTLEPDEPEEEPTPAILKELVDHCKTLDEDDQLDLLRIAKKFGKQK